MTEREYGLATNLAKLQIAEAALRCVFLYGEDEAKKGKARIAAVLAVERLKEWHERQVEKMMERDVGEEGRG